MIRCLAYAFKAIFKSRARLVAENLCLRQQLIVLKRRQARPQLRDADRRFWVLTCQGFSGWRRSLIVVKPDTVVSWHRKAWKAYWRWRSRRFAGTGRRKIDPKLRELIRRMARENPLWGQRRIQAELARLGFSVCARTVARYMRRPYNGTPSPVGNNSCISTPTRSGRVICLRFKPSGFEPCMFSLSSSTALVSSYMRESLRIPSRCGWRNKWSKPAGYRGNHRVT